MRIEVYSDVVCPWCYIGKRRLEEALAASHEGDAFEVVYRPFQLDPGAPARAEPIADYLTRRFGAGATTMQSRVGQVAAGEGIGIVWDRALMVNTMTAHRLLGLAATEYDADVQRALAERLFEAHFTEGSDISNDEQLTAIAASVGMDAARVSSYLASGEGESAVRDDVAAARSLGVQSVPTFVFDGRFALQGAQSVETFVRAIEQVRGERAPS